jgi:adenylate kinase
MDLTEVSADAMLREMARRLECLSAPEKRIILVGTHARRGSVPPRLIIVCWLTCSRACAGPPGCGKGTQSPKIKSRAALPRAHHGAGTFGSGA